MKKILRILLPFMILMGVTGCMTKSVPANEQMVQYMESKYGESFTFLEYTGGKFGDSTFNGFVSSETFPDAKIFGLTTGLAVMKINSELGYRPVTFSELTDDEAFWKGCQSCVNYDILQRTNRRMCLCTGMLFDPHAEEHHSENQ